MLLHSMNNQIIRSVLCRHTRRFISSTKIVYQETVCAAAGLENVPETPPPEFDGMKVPPPYGEERPVPAKIERLYTQIAALNLMEVSELSGLLKRRLNLPDAPMMMAAAGGAKGAVVEDEEDDENPKAVKNVFNVKLLKIDDAQKIATIKEVKNIVSGLNLVQAKKFVESAPVMLMTDVSKEEMEKIKEAMDKVGAVLEVV